MKQITKDCGMTYEYLIGTDFEDIESLEHYLKYINASYRRDGFNLYADPADVRRAEGEYRKEMQEIDNNLGGQHG